MDVAQLRNWLGLPDGPWPPDHYTLLGLPTGQTLDPAFVELKALEQMERLRPHQLKHPEVVTEGMNSLAQAMIALTTPVPKPAAVKKPKSAVVAKPATRDLPESLSLGPTAQTKAVQPVPTAVVAKFEPVIFDAEVVEPEPEALALGLQPVEEPADPVPIPEPPPGLVYWPENRRQSYRKLAELRRLQRALMLFRPTVAIPSEGLFTPSKVLSFLEACDELRQAILSTWPLEQGKQLHSVVQYPLALSLFRTLVPQQRQALAQDWARAMAEVHGQYLSIRDGLKRSRPRRGLNRLFGQVRKGMHTNPEWVLVIIALVLTLVGFARSRNG